MLVLKSTDSCGTTPMALRRLVWVISLIIESLDPCLKRRRILTSPDVLSVNQNSALAFSQVIKTIQKSQDSGFSCTRLAYKCNRGPFRNFERYSIECRYPVIIREMNIFWKFNGLIHCKFGAGTGTNRILSLHRAQSSQGHWVCR